MTSQTKDPAERWRAGGVMELRSGRSANDTPPGLGLQTPDDLPDAELALIAAGDLAAFVAAAWRFVAAAALAARAAGVPPSDAALRLVERFASRAPIRHRFGPGYLAGLHSAADAAARVLLERDE